MLGRDPLADWRRTAEPKFRVRFLNTEPETPGIDGVTTCDHIDQQPAVRDLIKRGHHPRSDGWGHQPWPDRDQESHTLGQRNQRGRDDPGIIASSPGWQKRPVISK